MSNPTPRLANGTELALRGYWNGSTLTSGLNFRSWTKGSPYEPPAPVNTQVYGVSATDTSGGKSFLTGYTSQVSTLKAKCCYYYGTGENPTWSPVAAVPSDHDIWFQTKAQTKAAYVALINSMPVSRTGKVYLHYWNEPENDIKNGGYTLAHWQQRTDWLFEAIDEAIAATPSKSYIKKSIEIQYYTLQQYQKGLLGANNERNLPGYIRPGLQQLGWSNYAEKKEKPDANGVVHEVFGISPVKMPQIIAAYMATLPGVGWSSITGWALGNAYLNDPVSILNRVNWFLESSENLRAAGSKHYMWFDIPWSNGDYRISTDPALYAAWQSRLTGAGQW